MTDNNNARHVFFRLLITRFFVGLLGINSLLSMISLLSIPTDPKNAVIFTLSLPRFSLFIFFLGFFIVPLCVLFIPIRDKEQKTITIVSTLINSKYIPYINILLVFILMMSEYLAFITSGTVPNSLTAIYIRLRPFFVWTFLSSLEGILFILILSIGMFPDTPFEKTKSDKNRAKSNRPKIIPKISAFASKFIMRAQKNKLITNKKLQKSIMLILLFFINLQINGWIQLKALVLDDLRIWMSFDLNRNHLFAFVFSTFANKLRPVFHAPLFILFKLIGTNIWLFDIINLLLNFLIVTVLFFMFYKICKSIIASGCLCVAYIVSRFAYYQISQVLGIMEAMGLLFAILVLYALWRYLNTEKLKYYWITIILFTLLIFVHERYISLLFLFLVALVILGISWKNVALFFTSTLPVAINLGIKIFILNIRAFDGTGGTSILETFNINENIRIFLSAWAYIFGINAGPQYLNGIPREAVPLNINILIIIGIFCILFLVFTFSLSIKKMDNYVNRNNVNNVVLFFSFIFSTILGASVTFRLEMRWLYTPFTGLLFLLAYIIGVILANIRLKKIVYFLLLLWVCMIVPTGIFYRGYYKYLYYWCDQSIVNSLYETTIGKYGDDFWKYQTVIINSNNKGLPINDETNFFKQFEKVQSDKPIFLFISDISESPNIDDDSEVLQLLREECKIIEYNK